MLLLSSKIALFRSSALPFGEFRQIIPGVNAVLSELQSQLWVMEPRALEAFLLRLAALENVTIQAALEQLAKRRRDLDDDGDEEDDDDDLSGMKISNGVASVPVNGILMKRVPDIFKYYGIGATSYLKVGAMARAAVENPGVHTIVLKVESPGGSVSGVEYAADAIFQACQRKAVIAEIQDIGASGAYWLASQAKHIVANPAAMVGSIGVYTAYADTSRMAEELGVKVHLISTGEHKGMGTPGTKITAPQLAAMQEVISAMGREFNGAVARGRRVEMPDVDKWATGRVWLAGQAKELGLIDSVGTFETALSGVRGGANSLTDKGDEMTEQEKAKAEKEQAELRENAAKEARAQEAKRLQDLKAAFPDDQPFAFEQFEKGASVDQAKVAYCDVLRKREADLKAENAALKKVSSAAGG